MTASASERSKIIQAFTKVEKQYPRDYRFPYERAKFVVKAKRRTEAFKALKVAAEKAITTGKANEMLSGLETDKTPDFSELSQGRFEWSRLVAALKRKDTSLLVSRYTKGTNRTTKSIVIIIELLVVFFRALMY